MYKTLFSVAIVISTFLASCSSSVTVETADNFEQVILPDSSVVSLNENSKITYNEDFEERVVQIEGEAFFSVEEGETPFIVQMAEDKVEVTGTEFFIHFHNGEIDVEVELGSVILFVGGHDNGLHRGQRGFFTPGGKVKIGKAKYGYRGWHGQMKKQFKANGRPYHRAGKHSPKNKMMKDLNKDLKKSNKSIQKGNKKPKMKGGGLPKMKGGKKKPKGKKK